MSLKTDKACKVHIDVPDVINYKMQREAIRLKYTVVGANEYNRSTGWITKKSELSKELKAGQVLDLSYVDTEFKGFEIRLIHELTRRTILLPIEFRQILPILIAILMISVQLGIMVYFLSILWLFIKNRHNSSANSLELMKNTTLIDISSSEDNVDIYTKLTNGTWRRGNLELQFSDNGVVLWKKQPKLFKKKPTVHAYRYGLRNNNLYINKKSTRVEVYIILLVSDSMMQLNLNGKSIIFEKINSTSSGL